MMIQRLIVAFSLIAMPAAALADDREVETETEYEYESEVERETGPGADFGTHRETETETEVEMEREGAAYDSEMDEGEYADMDGFVARTGIAAEVGGGVYGFTDPGMRDVVDVGGLWNARLIVGTRSLLGVELAYVGTASGLDALGLDESAVLVANGGEAALRLNIMQGSVRPFLFGGVGFKHYQLVNESFNTSSVRQSDDVLELPVGAGVDFQLMERMILGARLAVRPAFDENLVGSAGEPEMHTMSGDLRLGYQF